VLTIIESGSRAWALAATDGDLHIYSREQAGEWAEVLLSEDSEQIDQDGSSILEALYEERAAKNGEVPEPEAEEEEEPEAEEEDEPEAEEEDEPEAEEEDEPEAEEEEEPEAEEEEPEAEEEESEEEEEPAEAKPRRSRGRPRTRAKK
jgi:hypothetical protein